MKLAGWLAINLQIDTKTKKWSITSLPMTDQNFVNRNYDDITAIFKAKPETYKVFEEKTPDGKFKSFTVSTV